MNLSALVSEVTLLLVSSAFWLNGYVAHDRTRVASAGDTVRLPRIVAVLFGRIRQNGELSTRGIVTQMLAYGLVLIFTLMNLEIITRSEALQWTAWTMLGLLVSVAILNIIRRRQ